MLAPKGKLTKTFARKSTSRPMTEEEKKKWGTQLEDNEQRNSVDSRPRLGMKLTKTYRTVSIPTPRLETKKAKAVDNPRTATGRVASSTSSSKPKMKTLKGKIQMALYKAKNMKNK